MITGAVVCCWLLILFCNFQWDPSVELTAALTHILQSMLCISMCSFFLFFCFCDILGQYLFIVYFVNLHHLFLIVKCSVRYFQQETKQTTPKKQQPCNILCITVISWSWCDMSLALTLGINAMGGECAHANQMALWVVIHRLKSSSVGAFTWSSLRWFQSVVVWTKKKRVLVLFSIWVRN